MRYISRNFALGILLLLAVGFVGGSPVEPRLMAQSAPYALPNDDAGCPGNCRQIPWRAGSDLWNGGALPVYTSVPCTGLTEGNGTTDNTSAINSCIGGLSSGQAALIPPGTYYVNGTISLRSNTVLRGYGSSNCAQGRWLSSTFQGDTGSGAACTTLKFGAGGWIKMAGDVSTTVTRGSEMAIVGGYTKGSTTLTVGSGHGLVTGDWIAVYEQPDSAIPVTPQGAYGNCSWCGESNNSKNLMSQIVQVSVSGNTLTLSRPLYYTFKSALSPKFRKYTFLINRAGVEAVKLNGSSASRTHPHIGMSGSLFCWVKDVEMYRDPDDAKAFPVFAQYTYGAEIRDSYMHFSLETQSDRAYSVGLMQTTSDNKVENNIFREQRHGGGQEGGGSGNVWLYNYIDDLYYTYDWSWKDSMRLNHGAHPYMTLVEGNVAPAFGVDVSWGSSSHGVLFRNWFWGDITGSYSGYNSSNPNNNFNAVRIDYHNNYYSAVGNVLGHPNLHTSWANATMHPTNCNTNGTRNSPTVYWVGCDDNGGSYISDAWDTMIRHGNYDYKTNGVAEWGGGSNHTLKNSMYYASKPAFFGGCAWPAFGPDISPVTNTLPAKARYEGSNVCGGTSPRPPTAPANLRIIR